MKNYYSILGVPQTASQQDIKKAYHDLAKLYHPDINKDNNAHEKFVDIGEAYEILYNPTSRKEYDELLRSSYYSTNFSAQQAKARQQATEYANMNLTDLLNDILNFTFATTKTIVRGQEGLMLGPDDYIILGLKGTALLVCIFLFFTGIGTIPGLAISWLIVRSLFKDHKFVGIGPLLISTLATVLVIGFFIFKLLPR
jgi:hypothetical protein